MRNTAASMCHWQPYACNINPHWELLAILSLQQRSILSSSSPSAPTSELTRSRRAVALMLNVWREAAIAIFKSLVGLARLKVKLESAALEAYRALSKTHCG